MIPKKEGSASQLQYTVKKGDSLWKIANNNNTTVDVLKELNNLKTDTLSIGQILVLPSNSGLNYKIYIVKKGDSLWKIANSNNITVDALKKLNNLATNLLQIGQSLKIPT